VLHCTDKSLIVQGIRQLLRQYPSADDFIDLVARIQDRADVGMPNFSPEMTGLAASLLGSLDEDQEPMGAEAYTQYDDDDDADDFEARYDNGDDNDDRADHPSSETLPRVPVMSFADAISGYQRADQLSTSTSTTSTSTNKCTTTQTRPESAGRSILDFDWEHTPQSDITRLLQEEANRASQSQENTEEEHVHAAATHVELLFVLSALLGGASKVSVQVQRHVQAL
jgi:hypothetical protein